MEKKKVLLLLFALFLFQFFLIAGLWHQRPLPDEGRYLTTGWLISKGKVPFKDTFSPKPPAIEFVAAGLFTAFGPSLFAARMFIAFIAVIQLALIFALAKKAFGEKPALIASLFYCLWSLAFSAYWMVIGPFLALISTAAIFFAYLYLYQKPCSKNAFLLGLFLGLDVLFKQTMLPFALGMLLVVLAISLFGRKRLPSASETVSAIIGLAAMPLLFLLYLFATGSFSFFVEAMLFPFTQLNNFAEVTVDTKLLIAVAAFVAVPLSLLGMWKNLLGKKVNRLVIYFSVLWFVFSFSNALPFRSCCIHLLPALPAASIFAGFMIARGVKKGRGSLGADLLKAFSIALIILSVFSVAFFYQAFSSPEYSFTDLENVASYVKQNSASNDNIMVFPATPELYFLSQRMPSARQFIFFDPCDEQCQQPVVEELSFNSPKLMVFFSADSQYAGSDMEKMLEFREQNYFLLKVLELEQPVYKTYGYAFIFQRSSN